MAQKGLYDDLPDPRKICAKCKGRFIGPGELCGKCQPDPSPPFPEPPDLKPVEVDYTPEQEWINPNHVALTIFQRDHGPGFDCYSAQGHLLGRATRADIDNWTASKIPDNTGSNVLTFY